MNIKTLLSVLAIVIALFIGGVMSYINNAPNWSYILWGLAFILLVISLIYYFRDRINASKNIDNWIITYEKSVKKLPPIPEYLLPVVQRYIKGNPITKDIEIIPMNGQFWSKLLPSQKKELRQLVEWKGMNWDDYYDLYEKMLPKDLKLGSTHKPFKQ